MTGKLSLDEKYKLYESAVQCFESDIDFLKENYKKIYNRDARTLREDFGGTAALACNWVKEGPEYFSWGIDIDPEPMKYGLENHYSKLTKTEKERMQYVEGDVLGSYEFKADIIVAFNFSYFIFKKRKQLLEYFTKVREGLNENGAFFIDLFGGTEARAELVEETEHDDFTYFWDCEKYNPITDECQYYIHFKTHKDGKKHENVFSYDWRMWGIAELREIMEDAGFSKTIAFWEGEDGDGGGDGVFYETNKAENCESWVTYICALP
jgi:hypothetical protein